MRNSLPCSKQVTNLSYAKKVKNKKMSYEEFVLGYI